MSVPSRVWIAAPVVRSTGTKVAATALIAPLLVVASTTAAAAAVRDPSVMILRQADLPRSQYEADDDPDDYLRRPLKAAGLSGRVATYYVTRFSEQKGFLQVSGVVLTVASAADARRVLSITVKARDARLRRGGSDDWTIVSLPRYGDQQRARVSPPGNEGIANAELIVRKSTVVWLLAVTLERRPKPPVSELVAELRDLATKQQRRVGAG